MSRAVRPMTFSADELEDGARAATGLDDFGDGYYREGLERTVAALNTEADLTEMGEVMQHATIGNALIHRLQDRGHLPHIPRSTTRSSRAGLRHRPPRTGTTALSQLVAADPTVPVAAALGVAGADVPPPEAATQHTDPRIAQAEAGLAMMNEVFPLMQTHVPLRGDDRDRMPGPDGHELSHLPLRRCRSRVPGTWRG